MPREPLRPTRSILGTVEADDELRLLAAQEPPTIAPAGPPPLIAQLNTYGYSSQTVREQNLLQT
ncbi:hypothetical protein [Phormidium tenue]|uniref:hypothetical protein n=1 Tax=Phormidium tenue TaxID=126344 RepID=UPI001115277F|nr:hypothetical protein [Phormidium tenue]MBD2231045.1 hypothetical protein [Phormidium tenue FACHB-1052]